MQNGKNEYTMLSLSKPKLHRVKQNYYDLPYSVPINKIIKEYSQPVKISQ